MRLDSRAICPTARVSLREEHDPSAFGDERHREHSPQGPDIRPVDEQYRPSFARQNAPAQRAIEEQEFAMQMQIAQQPIGGLDEVLDRPAVHGSADAGQGDSAPLYYCSHRSADRSDTTHMNIDTQHSE